MILHSQNNQKIAFFSFKKNKYTSNSDEHTFVTVYFNSVDWPLEIIMLITGCVLPPAVLAALTFGFRFIPALCLKGPELHLSRKKKKKKNPDSQVKVVCLFSDLFCIRFITG